MSCKPSNFPNGINAGACLEAASGAIITLPSGIVETNIAYQVVPADDIISCLGTFTVTLPPILTAIKPVTITSVTVLPIAIEGSVKTIASKEEVNVVPESVVITTV